MTEVIVREPQSGRMERWATAWALVTAIWFLSLILLPDPRPLGAPEILVNLVRKLIGVSEPAARAAATFAMRAFGVSVLGFLVSLSLSKLQFKGALVATLVLGPLLAVVSLWLNYGYFPLFFQQQIAVVGSVVGGLAGLALRRSLAGKLMFVIVLGGLFFWGVSTGISNDVDETARVTGDFVLSNVDDVPKGDDGFTVVVEEAFRFAEDNSHRTSAVDTNRAVIVCLGVILGEQKIAKVAHRRLTGAYSKEISSLRRRVTLRERSDLPRHFWVSAALTVLSDQDRSLTVGIGKELMDAEPGGSGFSFVDLMADEAGNLFAKAATKNDASAREMQRLMRGGTQAEDFLPPIEGLPEGIPMAEFLEEYGGLGGEKTTQIADEIRSRLRECRLLDPNVN